MNADVGNASIVSARFHDQTHADQTTAAFIPSRFEIKSNLSGIFLTALYARLGALTADGRAKSAS